jgi:hypothetical protein
MTGVAEASAAWRRRWGAPRVAAVVAREEWRRNVRRFMIWSVGVAMKHKR